MVASQNFAADILLDLVEEECVDFVLFFKKCV
jgi:hypothetical protein